MRQHQFSIGIEFACGGKRWRCTDVGTRVVTAVCLSDHPDDPSWFNGPPYAAAEVVSSFDDPSHSHRITGDELATLIGFFSRLATRRNIAKVLPAYHIAFHTATGQFSVRVSAEGLILRDIAASTVQTGYKPRKVDLCGFLAGLTATGKPGEERP